jgi:hypothetical protein
MQRMETAGVLRKGTAATDLGKPKSKTCTERSRSIQNGITTPDVIFQKRDRDVRQNFRY